MAKRSFHGSVAHTALEILCGMGGQATVEVLRAAILSQFGSSGRFKQLVESPLLRRQYIRTIGTALAVTETGRAWLRGLESAVAERVPTMKPLRQLQTGPIRPGAMDFRDIPSLMGGVRVPYHGKAIEGS